MASQRIGEIHTITNLPVKNTWKEMPVSYCHGNNILSYPQEEICFSCSLGSDEGWQDEYHGYHGLLALRLNAWLLFQILGYLICCAYWEIADLPATFNSSNLNTCLKERSRKGAHSLKKNDFSPESPELPEYPEKLCHRYVSLELGPETSLRLYIMLISCSTSNIIFDMASTQIHTLIMQWHTYIQWHSLL